MNRSGNPIFTGSEAWSVAGNGGARPIGMETGLFAMMRQDYWTGPSGKNQMFGASRAPADRIRKFRLTCCH